MGKYEIEFAKSVRKDFRKIPKKDTKRILKLIESLSENPRPADSKKLTGEQIYRIRQGSYRILYEIEDLKLIVFVVRVGDRKEVYRK